MKIAHISDLHYAPEHLAWLNRAMASIAIPVDTGTDLVVYSGDLFDRALPLHDPSVIAAASALADRAQANPGCVLQGTFSHDRPGSLSILGLMSTRYPILIADQVGSWLLSEDRHRWTQVTADTPMEGSLLLHAMPSLNRADPEIQDEGAAAWVRRKLAEFRPLSDQAHAAGIPVILVAHGTVSGCTTESDHALISPDHEFDIESLLASWADAIMLGHIHKHQFWVDSRQIAAYAGSLTRMVHGDHNTKGWLLWDVTHDHVSFQFQEVPSRKLVEIEFDGPPNMDELREIALTVQPEDSIRVRYKIDQEHASSINKAAIRTLFAGADKCTIEPTVLAIESVRATGMCRVHTTDGKLRYYLETTGTDPEDIERVVIAYERLSGAEPAQIVEELTKK